MVYVMIFKQFPLAPLVELVCGATAWMPLGHRCSDIFVRCQVSWGRSSHSATALKLWFLVGVRALIALVCLQA